MPRDADPASGWPEDQAAGLRRRFAASRPRLLPVVANPAFTQGGLVLERLASACTLQGLRTLIVDAGEQARDPGGPGALGLASAIEPLDAQLAYLPARGLPLAHVDARGSTEGFLDAVADAAPDAEVVLLHASAAELARLLARRVREGLAPRLRPLVACDLAPEALTQAYAALKLLALRCGLLSHDLLVVARPGARGGPLVAERLARCAEGFLGGVQHAWVALDPLEGPEQPPGPDLQRLVRGLLDAADPTPPVPNRAPARAALRP